MKHFCVVGLQWGDEGKGKIVDVLTERVDAVVRYQGGANAGHTIYIEDRRFVLHHLPTGILREDTFAVLGNGMVIDPAVLLAEIRALPEEAVGRLYLSDRAHLVFPYHKARDRQREKEAAPIGTTGRGIGPAYEDKVARAGVRLGDLVAPGFLDRELERILASRSEDAAAVTEALTACRELVRVAGQRITDVAVLLGEWDAAGKRFLFEGAQGSLLDVDFGTYPYVTSSNASFHGLGVGSGFSSRRIDHVLGVTKAYCTRVGGGPFPSQAEPADEEALRTAGNEFGTTTGRPRRCGWLDLPALRYAVRMNDVDSLALTKADVLAGRPTIPVVTAYRDASKRASERFPVTAAELDAVEPVYEEWPGWKHVTPEEMAPFIDRLESEVGRPVSVLSSGRRRAEVHLFSPFAAVTRGEVV